MKIWNGIRMTRAVRAAALVLCALTFAAGSAPKADMAKFKVTGDPTSSAGATWTYESRDEGVDYKLNGMLFKPAGQGPFPAVLISHGQGATANLYGTKIGAEMVKWGLVCLAPNYTFAGQKRGEGAPGAADWHVCNATDNLKRVRKCLDILGALGYVDTKRVAVHGHSMGAFLTVAIAGAFPDEIRAASHTAGGDQSYNKELSTKVRAPYSIHHGDADTSVSITCDKRFEATLKQGKVEYEFHVYPGFAHRQTSTNELVLKRVRDWYAKHGVLSGN